MSRGRVAGMPPSGPIYKLYLLRFDNLSVLGSEKFDEFFEIVDVLYGPFNLKARMGYRLL